MKSEHLLTVPWPRFPGHVQCSKSFWLAHWAEGEAQKAMVKEAKDNLALLEAQLDGKRFFGGDTAGYVDIAVSALGPFLSVLEEVTGLTLVDAKEFPALCQWSKEYNSNEALKPCLPDRDRLVAYFTENIEMYKMIAKTMLQQ